MRTYYKIFKHLTIVFGITYKIIDMILPVDKNLEIILSGIIGSIIVYMIWFKKLRTCKAYLKRYNRYLKYDWKEKGVSILEEAIGEYRIDDEGYDLISKKLVDIYLKEEKIQRANEILYKYENGYKEEETKSQILLLIGNYFYNKNQITKAVNHYEKALNIIEKYPEKANINKKLFYKITKAYISENKISDINKTYDKLIRAGIIKSCSKTEHILSVPSYGVKI